MLPPDLQQRLEDIQNTTKRLQLELGIQPLTVEQRAQRLEQKKLEDKKNKEQLEQFNKQLGVRRPPPKWKV